MNDTIVAISTALGVGAISIIRLSGEEAIDIVNKSFKGKDLTKVNSHTINYGYIVEENETIDEVLVSIMKAPKTFTMENVVEINCHGGIVTTNKILEIMLNNGARLAEPGEFTKRAFLNGRIDLIESESIMELIESKNEEARKNAISGIKGEITDLINKFREDLKQLLSSIEVNIDYPEYYDIEVVTKEDISSKISDMKIKLQNLIKSSENNTLIRNGIKTVIVGKPNVGKSSILNKLLDEEKAIVTNIAGTTRDIVEGTVNLDGIMLNIIDTAGIRETNDIVEKIGVEKSIDALEKAELVIVVLNNNEILSEEDIELLDKTKDKQRIIVINKSDLTKKLILPLGLSNIIETNTNDYIGIEPLKNKIKEMFNLEGIKTDELTYLSSARQISLAKQAYKSLLDVEKGLNSNLPIDMLEIDLKNCFDILGEIIGITYNDEIIDNLFEKFCVGK